jgi:hypothetical protein
MKTIILSVFFLIGLTCVSNSFSQQASENWPEVSKLQFSSSHSVISIQWTAQSEPQQMHYEIESSNDGLHYKTVAIVLGGFEELGNYSYRFRENTSTTKKFFRIKQIKLDGSFRIAAEHSF